MFIDNNSIEPSINLSKKPYILMKVSRLGSLATTTQMMQIGIYMDSMGGSMMMDGN